MQKYWLWSARVGQRRKGLDTMRIGHFLCGLTALVGLLLTNPAQAQVRGGMPAGLPGPGGPPSFPGGIPGPGSIPATPGTTGPGAIGIARAQSTLEQRLSDRQAERAAELARTLPGDYELDRNGALAIRGEVLASGLDAAGLKRLERAGFVLLRSEDIPELGLSIAVLATKDLPASRALQKMRSIEPDGTYSLNHVMFESGTGAASCGEEPRNRSGAASAPVRVGLVDTGVAQAIDLLPGVQIERRNFAPSPSRADPHGTAVADLLTRGLGGTTVYAADIFGTDRRGGTSELLARALGWMARERIPVINVSMVGPANAIVELAVRRLVSNGFVIVAPVGNDGTAARQLYPASYPGVIAVSGSDQNGHLLPEASRVRRVDFVAPGIARVTGPSGRQAQMRGTSFAAPIVARLIADDFTFPDPVGARKRIDALAKKATRPKQDSKWFGRGLIHAAMPDC